MHKSIHIEQQVGTDQQFNLQTKKIYPYRSCTRIYRLHNSIWVYIRVLSFETLNYVQLLMSVHFFFALFVYNYGSYVPTHLPCLPFSCDTTPIHLPNHPLPTLTTFDDGVCILPNCMVPIYQRNPSMMHVHGFTTNLLCILNSMYTYTILTQDAVML